MRLLLAGSTDSRAREWRAPVEVRSRRERPAAKAGIRERGIALVLTLITILILGVLLAEMQQSTATSFALADSQKDRLRAEYLAKSGINLTRLLVAAEPQINQAVAPIYSAMLGGQRMPQLPVWAFANEVFQPFCDYERAQAASEGAGIDFGAAEGLGDTGGRCEIVSFAENSKLNVNNGLHMRDQQAQSNAAMQIFAMTGGLQQPSPYDPLFERRDPDGQITSRLDIISALIDWWDLDTERTVFDPATGRVESGGSEDNIYQSFRDPYKVKNAPFDSLEELRYVRGVGDDFWATFVEPNPDDPTQRSITVYGSGKVNPNEARPEVLLARTCGILQQSTFCTVEESAKFITVMQMVRSFLPPIPLFYDYRAWIQFLRGQGPIYPMIQMVAGDLMFAPVDVPRDKEREFRNAFVTSAKIITIQSTGLVGNCPREDDIGEEDDGIGRCTRVRIRSVMNFENTWTPPPPNAGSMPSLGIFYHWRVD